MPRFNNPVPAGKGKKFAVIIIVAVVLLSAFGVGLFFLIKSMNKGGGGTTPKVFSKWGNNGAVSCRNYCTNTGGVWGDKYKDAETAKVSGPGGFSPTLDKNLKTGDPIGVDEVPGAWHVGNDPKKPTLFNLDCGCSN